MNLVYFACCLKAQEQRKTNNPRYQDKIANLNEEQLAEFRRREAARRQKSRQRCKANAGGPRRLSTQPPPVPVQSQPSEGIWVCFICGVVLRRNDTHCVRCYENDCDEWVCQSCVFLEGASNDTIANFNIMCPRHMEVGTQWIFVCQDITLQGTATVLLVEVRC
jgi:hypothetical protein